MAQGKKNSARGSRMHRLRGSKVQPLSRAERLNVLDALSQVLDGVYVHLPLKRSLYGFDIIRGIEHLRQQLETMNDLQFHRELTALVNRLRDAHTQYHGPWTGEDPIASLPFLVESYGPDSDPQFVVSKVDRRSVKDPHFVERVRVEYWNGIPFARAVEMHADNETGGRPDSRRARALETLTNRWLEEAPPPDEEWVDITYRDIHNKRRETRLYWSGIDPGRAPTASRSHEARMRLGINAAGEAIRRAKKFQFNHALWQQERAKRRATLAERYADFLTARQHKTKAGMVGYLRVWSFDVDDDHSFLRAVMELLSTLPERGLIIDLRDNPGGNIVAAERMLQLLTPNSITPTKFALRATPLTAALAAAAGNRDDLGPWKESLATAQITGEPYSAHLSITTLQECNDLGQHYSGPVVLVVDANTYSSGDLFTAGFVDNRIGKVVCIGQATGAGGANVWESGDLIEALAAANRSIPRLPAGVSFRLALRRAVRTGAAEGSVIEDAGIKGEPYEMTANDLLNQNQDLIEHCASLLPPVRALSSMHVSRVGATVSIDTKGLDQLDVYFDGHPAGGPLRIRPDQTIGFRISSDVEQIDVAGFMRGKLRQRRRLTIARR